jgi:glycosyltransferase involved in cell wall biosynthesis
VRRSLIPRVSILLPCRNEAEYIARCLDSILAGEYPRECLEIVVADGGSTDHTRATLVRYAAAHPEIVLLDNPRGTSVAGLNLAIHAASGEVLILMDLRVLCPSDYVIRLVSALRQSGADKVGGVLDIVPEDDSPAATAIAVGVSHWLGVGNSCANGSAGRREVDLVPLGCYRREIFDRIGCFDEELIRTHDVEFDIRLITWGGKIVLTPDVRCRYLAGCSFRELARRYHEDGYYEPLLARKVRRALTIPQLIPAILVACLSTTFAVAIWLPAARYLFAFIAGSYALVIAISAAATVQSRGLRCAAAMAIVFPVLHFSYGSGFLRGIRDHLVSQGTPQAGALQLSR